MALNQTMDLLSWNVTDLKAVWDLFVSYHNAVDERLGDEAAGNETMEENQAFNFTRIGEPLQLETFWKPEYDQGNLTAVLEDAGSTGIAYEAFAFY